ncbi:MAG: 4Fe-4S dicluster domain-containing protein [Rhizobiales bacterium]|nr:4Fe-4S dicluster domain-containing protein [Hyphomicrobiales bacterium]
MRRAVDGPSSEQAVGGVTISASCLAQRGVACRLCDDACGFNAIRFRPQLGGHYHPEINSDICNGCLHCLDVCPVGALHSNEGGQDA